MTMKWRVERQNWKPSKTAAMRVGVAEVRSLEKGLSLGQLFALELGRVEILSMEQICVGKGVIVFAVTGEVTELAA